MVNQDMLGYGVAPSPIRKLFAYGAARKAEIGADKVFDFSIGNPSAPAPETVTEAIRDLAQQDPVYVHAYSQSAGHPDVRQTVAESLNRQWGTTYTYENLYLTYGASASISMVFKGLIEDGDNIATVAPYFTEYRVWATTHGADFIEVPARPSDFQIDIDAMDRMLDEHTKAVIINSPNNPVGTVYTRENLEEFAALLERKREAYGHPIFLISDEPYREISYGKEVPWVPAIYANTIVCYSYSKALSLPGERIGWVLVPDTCTEWRTVFNAMAGAGRALGYICAPVLFQRVIQKCVDDSADVSQYRVNRDLLTGIMDRCGFEYIAPDGAFYLWVKALEPDAQKFSDQAKKHELLIVPGDGFGGTGWVRLSYCVDQSVIERSEPAFAALAADYA